MAADTERTLDKLSDEELIGIKIEQYTNVNNNALEEIR